MTHSDHERAQELILLRDNEGVSAGDASWLDSHLCGCPDCAGLAEAMELTSSALRSVAVAAPSSLVMATQALIRQRAAELRDHEARIFLIGISFSLGLLWSAGSAFVGWKLSGWIAERVHVAPWIIASTFVIFWLAPAVAIAVGLLASHPLSYRLRADRLAMGVEEQLQ